MRSILSLSGSYGWFGLVAGNIQGPDVLFSETPTDGSFPPNLVRKYNSVSCRGNAANPLRNRQIDLRFNGIELAETVGNEACFRICPASLCKNYETETTSPSNSSESSRANSSWMGNVVVEGTRNPFYTRCGTPSWYNPDAMRRVFGTVTFKDQVEVSDNTIHVYEPLVERDRWRANQLDKIRVLDDIICAITSRQKYLIKYMKKNYRQHIPINCLKYTTNIHMHRNMAMRNLSVGRKRKVCAITEKVVSESMPFLQSNNNNDGNRSKKRRRVVEEFKDEEEDGKMPKLPELIAAIDESMEALSICSMLKNMCKKHKDRFIEGECRVAAHEMSRLLYRVSARNHTKNTLIRGLKWSVIWQRPYDAHATSVLKNVPRCRLPQIMSSIRDEGRLVLLNTRDMTPRSTRHALLASVYGEQIAKDISTVNCLEWINWCVTVYGRGPMEDTNQIRNLNMKKSAALRETKKRLRDELDDQTNMCSQDTVLRTLENKYGAGCYGPCKKATSGDGSRVASSDDLVVGGIKKRKTGRIGYLDMYIIAASSLGEVSGEMEAIGTKLKLYPIPEF